jgi:hypothetical protein
LLNFVSEKSFPVFPYSIRSPKGIFVRILVKSSEEIIFGVKSNSLFCYQKLFVKKKKYFFENIIFMILAKSKFKLNLKETVIFAISRAS